MHHPPDGDITASPRTLPPKNQYIPNKKVKFYIHLVVPSKMLPLGLRLKSLHSVRHWLTFQS